MLGNDLAKKNKFIRRIRLIRNADINNISCLINEITLPINRIFYTSLYCYRLPINMITTSINSYSQIINEKSHLGV